MKNTHWWNNSVVYQIYPKSFADSNNDGIGDIQGIISKLDYLRFLGIDIIWLSPVYASPQVDNGYDISNYQEINPDFGTMDDFDELIKKANQKGIKIMMDLVVNHTSNEHQWFIESRENKHSKFRDFYIWSDPVDGKAPNNWGNFFAGPAWTFDESSGQYYLHLFAEEQPDLNWENEALRQAIYKMMNWWVDKGVEGFRMDVISYISKPKTLANGIMGPDEVYANPEPLVAHGPRIHEFLREMNKSVMSKNPLVTVGETPGVTPEEAIKYADIENHELNMVFQFEHMGLDSNDNPTFGRWADCKASLKDLRANFTKWQKELEGKAWNSLYWNNHDQPRVVSRFGNDSTEEYRILSAKMLATMLHFQQGTPYIYEGEEIGMTNSNFLSIDEYEDLDSINPYHLFVKEQKIIDSETMMRYISAHSRDNARTPMQWDTSENAGFTKGVPWYKLNPSYKAINVEAALMDNNSIFYHYKKLINFRHTLPIITDGSYDLVPGNDNDPDVYAYTRTDDSEQLLIICNYTSKQQERIYDVPENAELLISNYDDDAKSKLRPFEAKVYHYSKNNH